MSSAAFINAMLKVDRAARHIKDLEYEVNSHLLKRPYVATVFDDKESYQRQIRVQCNHSMPTEFSLYIGDAIHNLRSALDIYYFYILNVQIDKPEAIQFPISHRGDEK